MQQTLEQQAAEWLKIRKEVVEGRQRMWKEYGILTQGKLSAIHVESLTEPLLTEVNRQLAAISKQ
jgi:hypothetical protein